MAFWAKWMFFATAAQIPIGAFTLFLVWRTYKQTQITAKAAVDAAVTAERALTDLERPFVYVVIKESGVSHLMGTAHLGGNPMVLECVNYGRSPADLLEFVDTPIYTDSEFPQPIIPADYISRALPPGTVSAPDAPFAFRNELSKRIAVPGGLSPSKRLFVLGYVRYADIFRNRYITGFCAVYDHASFNFVLRGDEQYNYTRKEA